MGTFSFEKEQWVEKYQDCKYPCKHPKKKNKAIYLMYRYLSEDLDEDLLNACKEPLPDSARWSGSIGDGDDNETQWLDSAAGPCAAKRTKQGKDDPQHAVVEGLKSIVAGSVLSVSNKDPTFQRDSLVHDVRDAEDVIQRLVNTENIINEQIMALIDKELQCSIRHDDTVQELLKYVQKQRKEKQLELEACKSTITEPTVRKKELQAELATLNKSVAVNSTTDGRSSTPVANETPARGPRSRTPVGIPTPASGRRSSSRTGEISCHHVLPKTSQARKHAAAKCRLVCACVQVAESPSPAPNSTSQASTIVRVAAPAVKNKKSIGRQTKAKEKASVHGTAVAGVTWNMTCSLHSPYTCF